MTTLAEFGARVKALRTQKGIKNKELAEALGISEAAMTYIQAGRGSTLPGEHQIRILAETLGTTFDTLMGANEDILSRYTEDEQALLKHGNSVNYVKLALAKMAEDMRVAEELRLDKAAKPGNYNNTLGLKK